MSAPAAIVIRPFRAADQPVVRALVLAGLGDRFGTIDETRNPDLDDIAATYLAPGGAVFVAERAGAIIGTATLTTDGWLVRMSVRRDARGAGLGRRLVAVVLAEARARGFADVRCETNDDWWDAIALYQRCGFVETDRHGGDVYFRCDLTAPQPAAAPDAGRSAMSTSPRLELVRWSMRFLDWAREPLLAAAARLEADALARPGVIAGGVGDGSVLAGLVHLCDGEEAWLGQWMDQPATFAWNAPTTLAALAARWQEVAARRAAWLATLDEPALDTTTDLRRGDVGPGPVALWQRMLHLGDHTAVHSGEIRAALTALGAPPVEADPFLFALTDAGRP